MVTTEDLRISLLAAEKKRMENLNRLNATIALLKDVDESIEIVNARKKLQENEVKKSNDELMKSLFQTVILLTTKFDELEKSIDELKNSKCHCKCDNDESKSPEEQSSTLSTNSEIPVNEEVDLFEGFRTDDSITDLSNERNDIDDIDLLEDYLKEATESM